MKGVVDANVVVSAIMGGVPAAALQRALKEDVYLSPEIAAEFFALGRRLHKRLKPELFRRWTDSFLPSVIGRMKVVEVSRPLRICRDPKDDAYLSLSAAISAEFLLTGDKDLLTVSPRQLGEAGMGRLLILTPREFIQRFGNA